MLHAHFELRMSKKTCNFDQMFVKNQTKRGPKIDQKMVPRSAPGTKEVPGGGEEVYLDQDFRALLAPLG